MTRLILLAAGTAILLAGCDRDSTTTAPGDNNVPALDQARGTSTSYAYSATNAKAGNAIVVFTQGSNGALTPGSTFATGGRGSGTGLGSQGSLVVSRDGQWLFAVNAGSNEVSVFRINGSSLSLTDRKPSGGDFPVSLTFENGFLYVLNQAHAGNIFGFALNSSGQLTALAGSRRPLSGAVATAAAQVSFTDHGRTLVVTEKATNTIDTYQVGTDGLATGPSTHASAGVTPFGFTFTRNGNLLVSEAFGGTPGASAASSYASVINGNVQVISSSVENTQTASCWLAVSGDERFAYVANTGSGTISSYRIHKDATLELRQAIAAQTGAGSAPIDLAFTSSGVLYNLNETSGEIDQFQMGADGSLVSLGSVDALPAFAAGLAVR